MKKLEKPLVTWFKGQGRDLPWRHNRTPYRVWLSEIMLQQTQVATVIDYYERFTARFSTVQDLSEAPEDTVMALWSGLGYYSRARNLHKTAQIVVGEYAGVFPQEHKALQKLPGIGSYTAGAILAFAFNKAAPVVDGNIARVLSRLYNDETLWGDLSGKKHFEAKSFELAQKSSDVRLWQEGLMELGALICKPIQPDCERCPLIKHCKAYEQQTVLQLPKLLKKPEKTRLDVFCELKYDDKNIWLEKNRENKLFKGLYAPPACPQFEPEKETSVSIKRTLTHRHLHLHAKLRPMSSRAHPSPHWIPRNCLNEIGLSAAIKTLLQKAALLTLLLTISCASKGPLIRYVTSFTPKVEMPEAEGKDSIQYARSLIGKSLIRSDGSPAMRAILEVSGKDIGSTNTALGVYRHIQQNGHLDFRDAKPGDLVFFHTGNRKSIAHIGFVESVLPDDTVLFIHQMGGVMVRSRLNLNAPSLQLDPKSNMRLNHILRRVSKKGYTTGQLFAGFGRLSG